jgi:hypothetical protein
MLHHYLALRIYPVFAPFALAACIVIMHRAAAAGITGTSGVTLPGTFASTRGAADDGSVRLPVLRGFGEGGFGRALAGYSQCRQFWPGLSRLVPVTLRDVDGERNRADAKALIAVERWRWYRPSPTGARQGTVY